MQIAQESGPAPANHDEPQAIESLRDAIVKCDGILASSNRYTPVMFARFDSLSDRTAILTSIASALQIRARKDAYEELDNQGGKAGNRVGPHAGGSEINYRRNRRPTRTLGWFRPAIVAKSSPARPMAVG
jgi:hypothetical protein